MHPKSMDLSLERTVQQVQATAMGLRFDRAGDRGGRNQRQGLDLLDDREHRARMPAIGWACTIKPQLVRFEERCRVGGEAVSAQARCADDFMAVERARGDVGLTQFRVQHAGHHAPLLAMRAAGPGDPGSGAGRALRFGQCVRRRLFRHHQHRAGPHGVAGPRPRKRSAWKRRRSCAPGKPAIVSDPHAAAPACSSTGQADRCRPVAGGPRLQPQPATASNGHGAGEAGATPACPTRRCAVPTSCSMRRARSPR
jgi:dihydrofolate synthase/folylpolyglutamate synthase